MGIKILVADDDPDIQTILCDWLQGMGHDVVAVSDGQAALTDLEQNTRDLLFLDVQMPKLGGMDVLRRIRKSRSELPIIIMTAHGSIGLAVDAMKEGASDFISKPFEIDQLDSVVTKALERKNLKGEVERLLGEISHDVKNFLMPVVCGSQLLESEIADMVNRLPEIEAIKAQESHKLCNEVIMMLQSTARRTHERMKEVADYVKSRGAPPRFAPCQFAQVAESVLQSLRFPTEEKGISLRTDGLDALPTIMADQSRLYTALYNLVHNAIPAVPHGGSIAIRGRYDADRSHLSISVEDTGSGMPPEVRDSLFTARAVSQKPGGTGLGSRIVKDAVAAHGGEITVESTEGLGTKVLFRLPLRPQMNPPNIES